MTAYQSELRLNFSNVSSYDSANGEDSFSVGFSDGAIYKEVFSVNNDHTVCVFGDPNNEVGCIPEAPFHVVGNRQKQVVSDTSTADDYGSVKLFNYPCIADCSPDKCYRGHSAQITNISFNFDDSYCISVGGEDQCIFIWATDIPDERREKEEAAKSSNIKKSITIGNANATTATSGGGVSSAATSNSADAAGVTSNREEEFECKLVLKEPKGGDEFTAVNPTAS